MPGVVIAIAVAAAFAAMCGVEWACYRLGLVYDALPERDERGSTSLRGQLFVTVIVWMLLIGALMAVLR